MNGSSNRFSNMVAILIALVTTIGAIIAWRVAVASSDAGSADTTGLLVAVDREDATTQATLKAIGHQTAYAAFVHDDALSNALTEVGDQFSVLSDALKAAANRTLDYVPRAYIDRNENLDVQRDLGENLAQETLSKDVNPQPHFASADLARSKAQWLLFVLIWFGVALVLLTMADAIQNPLRYALLAGGLGIFVFGTISAAVIESIAGRM